MNPEILFENDDVLVVNKPAGLVVHGDGRTEEMTLADWLVREYPEITSVGEPWEAPGGTFIPRPGIVHRLDRDTSGVMIIARSQEAFEFLKKAFQEREIEKTYYAFVYGNILEESGTIDKPIAKSKKDFRMWSAQPGSRGMSREAVTEYRVLARAEDKSACLVEAKPRTGRTHQIRVHMKAIHHPLVCDALYAPNRECLFGFGRVALHARALTLTLPSGKIETFEAPFPDDFIEATLEIEGGTI